MLRWLMLLVTHVGMLGLGFVLGIDALPILTPPRVEEKTMLRATTTTALFRGHFDRNLKGSDFVHWGEGEVRLLPTSRSRRPPFAGPRL